MESHSLDDYHALKLKLSGYTKPGQELFRNVLFDQLYAAEVQIANGAAASAAVLAAIADANAAILAAADAQVPGHGGDTMLTTNSHGKVVWDSDTAEAAYVKAASPLGQEMIDDANLLKAFNTP